MSLSALRDQLKGVTGDEGNVRRNVVRAFELLRSPGARAGGSGQRAA